MNVEIYERARCTLLSTLKIYKHCYFKNLEINTTQHFNLMYNIKSQLTSIHLGY